MSRMANNVSQALFSTNAPILPGDPGRGDYAWVTVVFVILTFLAAFSIEPVQKIWSDHQKAREEKKLKEQAQQNIQNEAEIAEDDEAAKKRAEEESEIAAKTEKD